MALLRDGRRAAAYTPASWTSGGGYVWAASAMLYSITTGGDTQNVLAKSSSEEETKRGRKTLPRARSRRHHAFALAPVSSSAFTGILISLDY